MENLLYQELHGKGTNLMLPLYFLKEDKVLEFLELGTEAKKQVEEFEKFASDYFDDIYFLPNNIYNRFIYRRDLVEVEMFSLDKKILDQFQTFERIEYLHHATNEMIVKEDYEGLFTILEKRNLIPHYIELFYDMPDKQRYTVFRDMWLRSEYGFDMFEPDFLDEVFTYRFLSEEWQEDMKTFKSENPSDELTIYRGITHKSTPVERAISWTLDHSVANFFATRFRSEGQIYIARVRKSDILDYLPRRSEKEVFVKPEKVFNIRRIK